MKVTIDDNVTVLPVTPRPNLVDERVFTMVPGMTCWHRRYLVDDKKAEVECADCHEKLNPMWVLQQLAFAENRYHELHARYHDELKRLGERSRTKCEHCGQMTRISKS
ncbi:hypothetical protein [Pararobbsia alpina]|uniref:hypothetical protein n=1 Tax=Pararobbsia alpina TaxID=621374 RepID=UPI0039A55C3A